MALRGKGWGRAARHLAAALLVGGLGVLGCGKHEAKPDAAQNKPEDEPRAAADAAADKGKAAEAPAPAAVTPVEDELHHPFVKAVRQGDDPPADSHLPPPKTCSGKSVYKIYKDVVRQWDGIRFTTAGGKRVAYSATIATEFGEIEIELRPDLAPNHVRNFVALARAGYYDRLFFERVNHEEYPENPGVRLDHIEAGCPLGTGEDGFGSLGYWLLPETQPSAKATHEEGTVGACRGMDKDSAGCRFYITLCKAPFNDGHYTIFGKVTRGLEVARMIHSQPVAEAERGAYGCHALERPVMMQKVLIHTREVAATEGKR